MRLSRTLVAAAVLTVATAGAATALVTRAPSAQAATLTWADDFNGPAGSAPDGGKWRHDVGGHGWNNQELEYYTTSTSNASLDGNGHLVITARRENPAGYGCWYGSCQYTSARLVTSGQFTQAYGRFEASIKIPRGQGMWPAFWMQGDNFGSVGWPANGEIDVMENIGREPGTNHGSLHGPGYFGGNSITGTYTLPGGAALADSFHTYTVDWAPDAITFYVDGIQYERRTPADTRGNRWVFDHPLFILLNVAVGGTWPGSPDGSTSFPQQMVVDYVHVFSSAGGGGGWGGGGGATGAITGYGNKCVDVAGANPANGTPIQLWDCNGSGAQRWTVGTDGTIRALGKCMDVTDGSKTNGAKAQLYECNGTGAQQWRVSGANDIVNPQSNKCLDASGWGTANGTGLQIWDCTGGANQKWHVPS